jgi:hypothetical protein
MFCMAQEALSEIMERREKRLRGKRHDGGEK